MSDFLIIDRNGAVVTARLNRPDTRNALTEPTHMQEIEALCRSIRVNRSGSRQRLPGQARAQLQRPLSSTIPSLPKPNR